MDLPDISLQHVRNTRIQIHYIFQIILSGSKLQIDDHVIDERDDHVFVLLNNHLTPLDLRIILHVFDLEGKPYPGLPDSFHILSVFFFKDQPGHSVYHINRSPKFMGNIGKKILHVLIGLPLQFVPFTNGSV